MRRLRVALAVGVVVLGSAACSAEAPDATMIPTTGTAALGPDSVAADGGSGDTTADEHTDACATLRRTYFDAVGADGQADALQPLYDAVTPLLPEEIRGDWELATAAFIAYEDELSQVPAGEDALAVPAVRDAYDVAESDEVQAAAQRVRDAIEAACPGTFD